MLAGGMHRSLREFDLRDPSPLGRRLAVVLALAGLPSVVAAAPPSESGETVEDQQGFEDLPAPDDSESEVDEEPEQPEGEVEPEPEPESPIVKLAEPKWIKHTIVPGERLDDIAARYDVSTDSLVRWNKLDKKNPKIYAGRELAIYTKHIPPPQRKLVYEVASGDTWAKIAGAHHVDVELLRERWNPKVARKFKAGQEIVIWIDPLTDPSFFSAGASGATAAANAALPLVSIPRGSISVGEPHDGRLVNSIQLPENKKLYTLRRPEEAYGSSHTLDHLQLAIARWRRDSGYTGSLKIGSISKQGGGKLKPHSSHRSGRDVDIRLPLEHKDGSADNVDDVDWDALWSLIMAFVDTGEVETIYLTTDRQKHLHAAAKRAKASADTIDRVLQYPDKGGRNNGIVRHQHGHEAHIHVRFTCAANETQCE
jgi:murein endopeptidase/LysM repeat protein